MSTEDQRLSDSYQPMKERVALVTGGSRGIGAATARQFARLGARVAVNYVRNEAAARSVVAAIEQAGGQAIAVQADVANEEQVEAMVQQVSQALGPIDILVLNAPATSSIPAARSTLSPAERFRSVLAPFTSTRWEVLESFVLGQLQSAFYPSKAVVPAMIQQHRGSIIFVSATTARQPMNEGGGLTISVGKAAVESMIRNMALELGPYGIRVNAIGAGHIITDINADMPQEARERIAQMTPLRRSGRPEDVAAAIAYLASDQASFVTGAYLTVGGGNLIM